MGISETVQRVGEPGHIVVVDRGGKGGRKTEKADLIELIQQTMLAHDIIPALALGTMSMEQLRAVLCLCEKLDETAAQIRTYQLVERGGLMCPLCDNEGGSQ